MSDAQITLEPRAVWCAEHIEPFRARWPAGYLPAVMCLVHQALNHDEEIAAAAGGEVELLDRVLREYGPLCCRLDPDMLARIVEGSIAGGDRMVATVREYGPTPPRPGGSV